MSVCMGRLDRTVQEWNRQDGGIRSDRTGECGHVYPFRASELVPLDMSRTCLLMLHMY
jgi:hypothetical protein